VWSEFKAFLLKTNALALAIAFILGLALAAVVNSLVADIIMPPVGLLFGGVDFQNLFIDLSGKHYATLAAAKEAGAATINYGVFLMTVITFIIVAWSSLSRGCSSRSRPQRRRSARAARCLSRSPRRVARCARASLPPREISGASRRREASCRGR